MNWFGGILTVVLHNGVRRTFYDLSFTEAQATLDALEKGSVREAYYAPHTTHMEQS